MSLPPQPPQIALFPSFIHTMRCLDTLKSHLESLHQGLQLAVKDSPLHSQQQQQQQQQQQPYLQTIAYAPRPLPQIGLPPHTENPPPLGPLPEISTALVPSTSSSSSSSTLSSAPKSAGPLPHPHGYYGGDGHRQAQQSFGGSGGGGHRRCPPDVQILAQINAAREGIAPANVELSLAIAALQREAEGIYKRIGSKTGMGIQSLKAVDESYRARDRQKFTPVKRETKSSGDCMVL